jgi:hypothetical protein
MRNTRKHNDSFCRSLSIFFNHLTKFGLHMGLKRLTDVDLLAADLIAHDASFAQVVSPGLVPGTEELSLFFG